MTPPTPHPLTCAACRELLPLYLDRASDALSHPLRQRVGAHLDDCPTCAALYARQRDVHHELRAATPLLGRADAPRLNAIWAAVQSDLTAPRRPAFPTDGRGSLRYSVVAAALLLALIVPLTISGGRLAFALPVPPTPSSGEATETASMLPVALPTAIAAISYEATAEVERPTLPPAPRYAPTAAATDLP